MRIFCFICFCFLSLSLLGQSENIPNKIGTISGKVTDESNGYVMEYVNIIVLNTKKEMIGGTITNQKGEFSISDLPLGECTVKISYIGFNDYISPSITLTAKNSNYKLPMATLSSVATTLQTVEVVGQKRIMEYNLDKKVINVEQNLVSDGGTAVDVLQNVPAVTVDQDGNVSMKGSSNVTILIDGRPAELSGMGLDQLPAGSIESIEIISNPSAKYNPEGMSGILNIKTKKRSFSGINGVINASGSTADRHNASANLNIGLGKVSLFTALSGNYMNRRNRSFTETFTQTSNPLYPGDDRQYESGEGLGNRKGFGGDWRIGADWRINTRNTLTLSAKIGQWESNRTNHSPETKTYSYNGDSLFNEENWVQTLNNLSATRGSFTSYNGTLAYKLTFANPKQELTLDASYDYNVNSSNTETFRNVHRPSLDMDSNWQYSHSNGNNYNFDAQLNYIHPFADKFKLEVGYQAMVRGSFSQDRQSMRIYERQDTAIDFNYAEQIHGVYANFIGELGNFSFQVGGRFEGVLLNANTFSERQDTSFSYRYPNYLRFYPAVHLSYKIGKKQDIQLSYSRRVNRPRAWSLNPFIDYSNYPLSISYGNPSLRPEDIHSLELNYSVFLGITSLYASIYYRFTNDVIRRYTFLDSTGMRQTTSLNYDRGTNYGIDITWEQQIFEWWRFNVNGGFYRNLTKGGKNADVNTEGFSYNVRMNMNFNLPKFFNIQLSLNYRGPSYWGQTEMLPSFNSEIAIRKGFFKNALTVGLRLSDIFNTFEHSSISQGVGFETYTFRKPINSRALYITLSYKINQGIKQTRKRSNTNESSSGMEEGGEM